MQAGWTNAIFFFSSRKKGKISLWPVLCSVPQEAMNSFDWDPLSSGFWMGSANGKNWQEGWERPEKRGIRVCNLHQLGFGPWLYFSGEITAIAALVHIFRLSSSGNPALPIALSGLETAPFWTNAWALYRPNWFLHLPCTPVSNLIEFCSFMALWKFWLFPDWCHLPSPIQARTTVTYSPEVHYQWVELMLTQWELLLRDKRSATLMAQALNVLHAFHCIPSWKSWPKMDQLGNFGRRCICFLPWLVMAP